MKNPRPLVALMEELVFLDGSPIDGTRNQDVRIGELRAASQAAIEQVLLAPVDSTEIGRSNFMWLVLANGDIALACFPYSATLEALADDISPPSRDDLLRRGAQTLGQLLDDWSPGDDVDTDALIEETSRTLIELIQTPEPS